MKSIKTQLSAFQFSRICRLAESGEMVSLLVQRAMPNSPEIAIDKEISRIYDAIEFYTL